MEPQEQTVMTTPGVLQPTYFSQPYLTASIVNSYRHRQSTIIGILLIIAGALSILFYIVEIAVAVFERIDIYCFWCGAVVSGQLSV